MALAKSFERQLDQLLHRRTDWVRRAIGRKRAGRSPTFDGPQVRKRLAQLNRVARDILIRLRAHSELRSSIEGTRQWHAKRGKGHGVERKREHFRMWFEERIPARNCIYIFWSGKRCEYVGKTLHGKGRPHNHFEKHWFSSVTRVDIHWIRQASRVPRTECLAIDLYRPRRNKISASKPRYSKKCPVCSSALEIEQELKRIFRLR